MAPVIDDVMIIARSDGEYHAYLQFEARPESRSAIIQQLAGWLHERGLEPSFDRSGFYPSKDRELAVLVRDPGTGAEVSAALIEHSRMGTWKSEVTLRVPSAGLGWCVIDVSNSKGCFVRVPRLARYILDVEQCRDGEGLLSSRPVILGSSRVGELIDIVCDPDRRGLAFVAGSATDRDLDSFARTVERWTRATQGLAQVIVLDPQATADFNEQIGADHAAPIWLLRTYLPAADPASSVDARRHKALGAQRLQDQTPSQIERMLGLIARSQIGSVALPGPVIKLRRSFIRLRDSIVVSGTPTSPSAVVLDRAPSTPKPRPAPRYVPSAPPIIVESEDDASADTLAMVKEHLGIDIFSEESLSALATTLKEGGELAALRQRLTPELEQRQARIDALEDTVSQLQGRYEEEQLEHAVAEEQRGYLADENRWLRRRLRELSDFETAVTFVPPEARTVYPNSFDELLERWDDEQLPGVEFTGDPAKARALDRVDTLATAVRAAWDVLLVLTDYLRAKSQGVVQEGVHSYLKQTPDGFLPMSHSKHAPNESKRTMTTWGGQRIFPIPADVDPARRATMEAHFKLGNLGMISPRLYYMDRWPTHQRIYVGYIGRHLQNTKTS